MAQFNHCGICGGVYSTIHQARKCQVRCEKWRCLLDGEKW